MVPWRRRKGPHGSEPPTLGITALNFDQVTKEFEKRYQGEGKKAGLNAMEKFLPPMDILKRLAAKYPMAIVTGRPRDPDCETAIKVI